ncbi:TPA: hypothetical protein I8Y12_004486 [Raoultella planticola]|nr:hypothetical protein [Raoultella planticola]
MDRSDNIQSYIIGEDVVFTPSQRMIVDRLNSKEVKLHVPASCCLEILLNNQGEIVSQDELILCGWGEKRNAGVSPNTYYQCILHLRKSLAAIGCADVIDTVPRHGLRFNNRLKVTYLYPEENNAQQTDNNINQNIEGNTINNDEGICIDSSELVEYDDAEPDDSGKAPPEADFFESSAADAVIHEGSKCHKGSKRHIKWLRNAGIVTILAIVIFSIMTFRHKPGSEAFSDYTRLSSEGCTIFSADQKYTATEVKKILNTLGLPCSDKTTIYFTASPMNTRLNFMYCSVYTQKNQNCRSLTIMKSMKVH